LVEEIERCGGHLPNFVRQGFEDYLKCGLLEHGFLRYAHEIGGECIPLLWKLDPTPLFQKVPYTFSPLP
jgi:hypothetical protein